MNIRRVIIFLLLVLFSFGVKAQDKAATPPPDEKTTTAEEPTVSEPNKTPEATADKSVPRSSPLSITLSGGASYSFAKKLDYYGRIRGAYHFGNVFALGLFGEIAFADIGGREGNHHRRDEQDSYWDNENDDGNNESDKLNLGYGGGIYTGLFFLSENAVHLSFPLYLGVGYDNNTTEYNESQNSSIDLFIEPGLEIRFRPIQSFSFGINGGYRIAFPLERKEDVYGLKITAFKQSFNGGIFFSFGGL